MSPIKLDGVWNKYKGNEGSNLGKLLHLKQGTRQLHCPGGTVVT